MPATSVCGADTLGENLYTSMGDGDEFTLPAVDLTGADYQLPSQVGNPLYSAVNSLTNADLTSGAVGGAGTFDQLMAAQKAHLLAEYNAGRITGDQYSKAYMEISATAMTSAVQFLLGRDQAYWNALLVQAQARAAEIMAVNAAVQLEVTKAELAKMVFDAKRLEGEVALAKMNIAKADAEYCILAAQKTLTETENTLKLSDIALRDSQKLGQDATNTGLGHDNTIKQYQISDMLPAQKTLIQEQMEAARAQTMDLRSDGITTIEGNMGKQKDLYDQQITSYQRDAEQKVAKLFSDAWTVQKTMDEGLVAPNQFTNTEIDEVLVAIRGNNGLGS